MCVRVCCCSRAGGCSGKEVCEWVQCDKESCGRWRRLPPNIDPNTLPEKWVCAMNWWDSLYASCAAPEERDDAKDDSKAGGGKTVSGKKQLGQSGGSSSSAEGGAGSNAASSSGGLLGRRQGGHGHGQHRLGYRDILFHPDGKLRPPFSEKSSASSLFW